MARRTNCVAAPPRVRATVRRMVLRDGVSATARALKIGREHALAIAGDLPVPPAVALFVNSQLRDLDQAA